MLTYEVDQIRTVLPNELSDLNPDPDQDYVTLLTCTPYGINTHRLLVHGHRTASGALNVRIVPEAVIVNELIVALVLAIPILFLLLMAVMLKKPEKPASAAHPDTVLSSDQSILPEKTSSEKTAAPGKKE